LVRLGKIKMGVMVQPAQGKPYPRATDFFVVPDSVQKVYGEKPRALGIMLPSDSPDEVFPQELKAYKASGLFCAGDNRVAKRWHEGRLVERPCPCEMLDSGECQPTATLNVMLYRVAGLGVWQLTVRQEAAIIEINTTLEKFTTMFGGLRGIPFVLRLEQVQRQRYDEKTKAMVKVMVWTPKIDTEMTLEEIFTSRKALGAGVDRLMLPAMGEIEEDDHPVTTSEATESPQGAVEDATLTQMAPPAEIVAPAATTPATDLFPAPAASQHDDPAPPAAAQGKVEGAGLLMDECFELAQKLDVDAATYRAYLQAIHGTVDLPHESAATEIERLRDAMKNPGTAGAAKAAMKAGARKIGGGR
jgi:hypothetical protein